jgi:2-keto-4-pentenoate hydratase/2-oxohepta-3-ene-1,7-dioic acid hydratase in catechol pathway
MRLAHGAFDGRTAVGVVIGEHFHPLPGPVGPLGVIAALGAVPEAAGEGVPLAGVTLLAPVPAPPRVFGVGLNYADHAAETGRETPAVQTWFMKQPTAVNAPFATVDKPAVSDMLDFEVELVVVIGKTCRHVPAERAGEVIAGYCVGCDYSVRDWQRATPTMIMGKGFDTHAPFGPWLTTPDEIPDLDALRLTCTIDGVRMQDGRVGDMIFKVPALIAHLTKAMTLLPGDLLFTGTPAGVGVARTPPVFLRHGQSVRCEIEGLGAIENRIADETPRTVIF